MVATNPRLSENSFLELKVDDFLRFVSLKFRKIIHYGFQK